MNEFNVEALLSFSNLIKSDADVLDIVSAGKEHLNKVKEFNMFFFENSSNKLKDVVNDLSPVEDIYDEIAVYFLYEKYAKLSVCDFIINDSEVLARTLKDDEYIVLENLILPLRVEDNILGFIEISFENDENDNSIYKASTLKMLEILSNHLLLWLQNRLLNNRIQINSDFYDALKNIAKIIETQYELNYIIPLIGEMIDKFVSNHLIYIFLKQGEGYNLFWPNCCRNERIYDIINTVNNDSPIITNDNKTGVFPLYNGKEVLGCIVAHSTMDKLCESEIDYIVQLTKQSSITIDRANEYAEVLQHATLDALTGLNNRRQFELRLGQEYASAKRQNHPLCSMMVDIDFFKSINDNYGHAMGDKVLKVVGSIIKEQLREYDIPSRYGGEEFSVLLPQTKIEEANIVAERLRAAVERKIIDESKKIGVTISVGLSQLRDEDEPEDLYKRADKALYEAKERGRNRVVVYYD